MKTEPIEAAADVADATADPMEASLQREALTIAVSRFTVRYVMGDAELVVANN